MLQDFTQDVRYGVRTLVQSPGLTLVAVFILTLGIGANTTIFTLVNALFFQQPPEVAEPERLVRVHRYVAEHPAWWGYPDYVFYREHNKVASLAAYDPDGLTATAELGGGRAGVSVSYVSDNYFSVLGTPLAAGRSFTPDECEVPGGKPVAIVSYGLWRRAFGEEEEALGATVRLNGHPFSVIGVAPPAFRGASPAEVPPDVWVPITMQPVLSPTPGDFLRRVEGMEVTWLQVLGRLADGVGPAAAQANMDAVTAALGEQYADWFHEGQGVRLLADFQYHPRIRDQLLKLTRLLAAVVGLVLAIAGANVAILLLARASARQKDFGVRVALGASHARLARQLLVESLLLALAGAAGGFALSFQAAELAARAMPFTFSVAFEPDLGVLVFTLTVAVAAAVAFGVAPVFQTSRTDVLTVLKLGDLGSGRSRLRDGLVVAQVALSIVLVTGAALFVRSLQTAEAVDLGYATDHRLVVSMNLANHGYGDDEATVFIERALERVSALPGVAVASSAQFVPFRGRWSSTLEAEHGVEAPEGKSFPTTINAVGPDYFAVMEIPIVAGRPFDSSDRDGAPRVAILNRAAAEAFWSGRPAVGRTFDLGGGEPVTVVGVAADVRHYELGGEPGPHAYLPTLQSDRRRLNLVIATAAEPAGLADDVRAAVHEIDPTIAFSGVWTMEEVVERVLGPYRVGATLVSLFGVLALVLAAVGLYGVLSYLVVRQTRAIGIRMALGATRRRVARGVVRRGLGLAGAGLALGVLGALAASRLVASFLYGIGPRDPASFVVVPAILAAVALLASLVPAWRASRIHPMEALREE